MIQTGPSQLLGLELNSREYMVSRDESDLDAPLRAEAVVREIVCANEFLCVLLGCDAAPERQEAGEHLDPHREASPRHVHSSRHGWNELSSPIDTLNIDGVVVAISRIPAERLDPLRQFFRLA